MGIVAIGALHQPFVHAMVKRHFKLGFALQMAGVTELRLRFRQKKFFGFGVMRRMAGDATHIVPCVDGVDGVHVLRAAGVAGHAARVDFLGRSVLKRKDFAYIAATGHVRRARAVAALTTLVRWTAFRVESGLPMRRFSPVVVNFLVAGLAGFRSHILRTFRRRRI